MQITKKAPALLKAAAICFIAVLVVLFPSETAQSTVNSINVCLNSIIPSMFAFMVISDYVLSSGLYKVIFRPVLPFMKHIIRTDDETLSVFLLSLFGGYPIGVSLLKERIAYNKNYHEIAGYASMFCYCISPSFALIMLGNGIFGSTAAGAVIYVSDIISCIITGAVISRLHDLNGESNVLTRKGTLTDAVNCASRALFTVCTVIVAFNIALTCLTCLLGRFHIVLPAEISGALEISNLLKISRPDVSLIPLAAAISSFGGICVLLQCTAIVKGDFPVKAFLLARIPCAVLSAGISWMLLQFLDISVSASTFSPEYIYDFSANKIIVPVLIAMCIIIFYKSDKIFKKV